MRPETDHPLAEDQLVDWLITSNEPWTRYKTLVDLVGIPEDHPKVLEARSVLVDDSRIQNLISLALEHTDRFIKRHNDASHPIYALSTLADFGLQANDPCMTEVIDSVLSRQSEDGPFLSLVNIPKAFGGSGTNIWTWMLCDSPTIIYALLEFGLGNDPQIQKAADHLAQISDDNGWHCQVDQKLGSFRGPGRKADPCPIANIYALKALALVPSLHGSSAVRNGIEAILKMWEHQTERKMYLFAMGTDFRKIKYPFVWFDILHVVHVLSQFKVVFEDTRFIEMLNCLLSQKTQFGRVRAGSMYRFWKEWSFANKKEPSPWLTYLVHSIEKRSVDKVEHL